MQRYKVFPSLPNFSSFFFANQIFSLTIQTKFGMKPSSKASVLPSVADFLPAAARCFGFSRRLFGSSQNTISYRLNPCQTPLSPRLSTVCSPLKPFIF
jgi:hypothetical protein